MDCWELDYFKSPHACVDATTKYSSRGAILSRSREFYDKSLPMGAVPVGAASSEYDVDSEAIAVVVSYKRFRLWWVGVVLFHIVNALFAMVAAAAHLLLGQTKVYKNIYMLAIEQSTLLAAGFSYAAIALTHTTLVASHFKHSIRKRRLTFHRGARFLARFESGPQKRIWRLNNRSLEMGYRLVHVVVSVFYTYQGQQLSEAVARPWFNALVVGVIVLNCARGLLVDRFLLRNSTGASATSVRLLTFFASDVIIDFILSVMVPVGLMIPRFAQFDFANGGFPRQLTYNTVWNTMAISEGRLILVSSTMDYFSSLFPLVSTLVSLETIKSMLCRSKNAHGNRRPSRATRTPQVLPLPMDTAPTHHSQIGPVSTSYRLMKQASAALRLSLDKIMRHRRTVHIINSATFFWSVVLLAVVLHARLRSNRTTPGCKLQLDAWLATKPTCPVVQINCNSRGIVGSNADIKDVLARLEPSVVRHVSFSHCPALEVPESIQAFKSLGVLATFNCTIASWSETAALSRKHSPLMTVLHLIDTNMTELPIGLVHDQLPINLNLAIHRSNLSTLPDNLGELWSSVRWSSFAVEFTAITSLPSTFRHIQTAKLSLQGTPITQLSLDMFEGNRYRLIRLSGTRIATLPDSFGDLTQLKAFFAENTRVAKVPLWIREWATQNQNQSITVSLHGSPACVDPQNSALCHELTSSQQSEFPYDIIRAQRPLMGD